MAERDEAKAIESRRHAARETSQLGPGTAGMTTSGAAYRGMDVAADTGHPSPADPGFPVTRVGLRPGQGVGGDSTYEQADDLSDQELNVAARPAEGLSAVDMLTSPVAGETPENRE